MPCTVKVNGPMLSVVTKGSNGVAPATIPDVCKTPTPGGPVPMPYPNVTQSIMLNNGTTTVKVDMMMAAIKGSEFSLSNGDQPGVAGGVKSSTIMQKSTWINSSMDTKFDGKAACRFTDPKFNNNENCATLGGELQGPVVLVDMSKVGKDQDEACEKLEEKEVKDHDKGAEDAGMLKEDYDALRDVAGDSKVLASFRDTNKACIPHLRAGVPSKGHDVLEKTWDPKHLPKDKRDEFAGLVSTRLTKPGKGEIVANPKRRLQNGGPLTGDYDMHDLISSNGDRVRGGSAKENRVIDRMNDAIPGDQKRVMHGPQANYGDFTKMTGEAPNKKLFAPDPPITVMDGRKPPPPAKVYRLKTNADIVNMYRCTGTNMPEEWDIRDKKTDEAIIAKMKG